MSLRQKNTAQANLLVDQLVSSGKIDAIFGRALKQRYQTISQIANFLLKQAKVNDEDLSKAISVVYALPFVHLKGKNIAPTVLNIISQSTAQSFFIVPFELTENTLKIAVGRPYNFSETLTTSLHTIEKEKGINIELAVTTQDDIIWALQLYNQSLVNAVKSTESTQPVQTSQAPAPATSISPVSQPSQVDLANVKIPQAVLLKFPKDIAIKYQMVVFDIVAANYFKVAAVNPNAISTRQIIDFVEKRNGIKIDLYQTSTASLAIALRGYDAGVVHSSNAVSKNNLSHNIIDLYALSAGESPQYGGKTQEGIPVVGTKEIVAVQSGILSKENLKLEDSDLEERNLDTFLGHEVMTIEELVAIIKSGFVPKMVAAILSYGIYLRASDIHLEPLRNAFRLRYRVDGNLAEYLFMPLNLHPPISSRIKILSNLKIDEQRIPQDGRYNAIAGAHEFDVRVSSLPTVFGEKIVMRLLDKSSSLRTLEDMGLTGSSLQRIQEQLKKPWGVIMSTGPTGSGKSTTLYAILNQIATADVNVITLEDPVEYEMKGINQVQVKPKIGFSFAEGLRSVLRQDPNIIMVGEIRDGETAELATQAALTGHIVLTTLHTNNAAGALPRLINMGVEPYLITSAMNAVIAQRLVRKLCQNCKKPVSVPLQVIEQIKQIMKDVHGFVANQSLQFFGPQGCDKCRKGFIGRTGIYEVLVMSDTIEEAAIAMKPASEIEVIARREGMITLQQDGIFKALKGLTTLDEIFKVAAED